MKLLSVITNKVFLISLGIIMTAGSAYINHSVIKANGERMRDIDKQIMAQEERIEYLWQDAKMLEKKHDFGVLLVALSGNSQNGEILPEAINYVKDAMKAAGIKDIDKMLNIDKKDREAWLDKLNETIKKYKIETVSSIDDIYIEKLELEEKRLMLREQNAVVSNIALLLQIMGMIFVLTARPSSV